MNAYDKARVRARALLGRLTLEQLSKIRGALQRFLYRVELSLKDLKDLTPQFTSQLDEEEFMRTQQNPYVQGLYTLQRTIAYQLSALDVVIHRDLASVREYIFWEIKGIWDDSGAEYAKTHGLKGPVTELVRVPPLTLMGAFEGLGAGSSWKTSLKDTIAAAGLEIADIVRLALAAQVDVDELALRLRKYVMGSQSFQKAFHAIPTITGNVYKLDLRQVTARYRGAAGQMVYNAERIAFSEMHNAKAEAEVQHMSLDPYIKSVRWVLAPLRGTQSQPDECDILAHGDFYGLGRGVYPVYHIPAPPHPWCRCEYLPVTRPVDQITEPKDHPPLQVDPRDTSVSIPTLDLEPLTTRAEERAREAAYLATQFAITQVPDEGALLRPGGGY